MTNFNTHIQRMLSRAFTVVVVFLTTICITLISNADEMDKTVANKDVRMAEVKEEYKAEVAKWDKAIAEKKEEFEKVEKGFVNFQKRHGLVVTG